MEAYERPGKPQLYACRNAAGQTYLVVLADEAEAGKTWLIVPVSGARFEQVRSGGIDLHTAFAQAEDGYVHRVVVPKRRASPAQVRSFPVEKLSDADLPPRDELLAVPSQTLAAAANLDELKARALQTAREHVALRLALPDARQAEVPMELLAAVLQAFHKLMAAVAASLREATGATARGPAPQLNVLAFGRGSLGVELTSSTAVNLFGESAAGQALDQILDLLEIGDDGDRLQVKLAELQPRVAVGYALWLRALAGQVARITVDWASPKEGRTRSATLAGEQLLRTVAVVERIELQPPETLVFRGQLIGANLRGKHFEIWAVQDGKTKRFRGRITDGSRRVIIGAELGRYYRVTLTKSLAINYATGIAESKYDLIKLELE